MEINDIIENKIADLRNEIDELRGVQDEIENTTVNAAYEMAAIMADAKDEVRAILDNVGIEYDDVNYDVEAMINLELDML